MSSVEGLIDRYCQETTKRTLLDSDGVGDYELRKIATWHLFLQLCERRRVVRQDASRIIFQAIDVGNHRIDGTMRRVVMQPSTVAPLFHSAPSVEKADPSITTVELEAVIPNQDTIDLSTAEGFFNADNSGQVGLESFNFGAPPTVGNYNALNGFRNLLQEVIDATVTASPVIHE